MKLTEYQLCAMKRPELQHRFSKREDVWIRAYCACASSNNVDVDIVPLRWADTCLKAFDILFGKGQEPAPEGKQAPEPIP